MSNVYDMNGKKKVVMEEKEDEDITYKEIMKIIIENATEEAFKNIIKKNINEDTYTIRNEIVRYWDGKTKK